MELMQLLHTNIPQRQKIFDVFKKKGTQDMSKLILQIIKKTRNNSQNIQFYNQFFIELYDVLYHHIIFDKIRIEKKILRILEELAIPMQYIGEQQRRSYLKKTKGIKI